MSEQGENIFQGNRFAALLLFQTFSNSIIKNTKSISFLLKTFQKIESGDKVGSFTIQLMNCVLETGLQINRENKLMKDKVDLKRIIIDEEERKEFDKGKGFNPRIRRKEELITSEEWNSVKCGIF